MLKLKHKKRITVIGIVLMYISVLIYLALKDNAEDTKVMLLCISLVFVIGGTLGIINKVNAFERPMVRVVPKKATYENDYSQNGIIGRVGNVLGLISGVIIFIVAMVI